MSTAEQSGHLEPMLWLQRWYRAQCNGDWEHSSGVHIGTLDNPGWKLEVNIEDTELEGRPFVPVVLERAEDDWITCRVEGSHFRAWGGPENLLDLISIFRGWASETPL